MKIAKTTLTELRADEGKVLVNKDGFGAKVVYLGIYDSPDNYTEINEEDYVRPEPELPEKEIMINEEEEIMTTEELEEDEEE